MIQCRFLATFYHDGIVAALGTELVLGSIPRIVSREGKSGQAEVMDQSLVIFFGPEF